MEVPKNLRKVKPNEVVVFEKEFAGTKDGCKFNAICLADYGLIMFHTDTFWTNGEVKFYGE